jgi:hypothetical protein
MQRGQLCFFISQSDISAYTFGLMGYHTPNMRTRRRWMRKRGMFDPVRLVSIDETSTSIRVPNGSGRRSWPRLILDF